MSVVQIGLLLLASFFLMLALSVPVSISLIVSSLITVSTALPLDLGTFVACQKIVAARRQLLAARRSFFILTGVLMNTGGIAQRLINLAKCLVGRIPGGLGTRQHCRQRHVRCPVRLGCCSVHRSRRRYAARGRSCGLR